MSAHAACFSLDVYSKATRACSCVRERGRVQFHAASVIRKLKQFRCQPSTRPLSPFGHFRPLLVPLSSFKERRPQLSAPCHVTVSHVSRELSEAICVQIVFRQIANCCQLKTSCLKTTCAHKHERTQCRKLPEGNCTCACENCFQTMYFRLETLR